MTPRFRVHRPHFDWLVDLALVGALAVLVLMTAIVCSFIPWS